VEFVQIDNEDNWKSGPRSPSPSIASLSPPQNNFDGGVSGTTDNDKSSMHSNNHCGDSSPSSNFPRRSLLLRSHTDTPPRPSLEFSKNSDSETLSPVLSPSFISPSSLPASLSSSPASFTSLMNYVPSSQSTTTTPVAVSFQIIIKKKQKGGNKSNSLKTSSSSTQDDPGWRMLYFIDTLIHQMELFQEWTGDWMATNLINSWNKHHCQKSKVSPHEWEEHSVTVSSWVGMYINPSGS